MTGPGVILSFSSPFLYFLPCFPPWCYLEFWFFFPSQFFSFTIHLMLPSTAYPSPIQFLFLLLLFYIIIFFSWIYLNTSSFLMIFLSSYFLIIQSLLHTTCSIITFCQVFLLRSPYNNFFFAKCCLYIRNYLLYFLIAHLISC